MLDTKRLEIESQIAQLRQEIAVRDQAIAALMAEKKEIDTADRVFRRLTGEQPATPASSMEMAISEIIVERGRPVPRAELLEGLAARGVLIDSKDPGSVVTMHLKRRPQLFIRFDPQGWWLRDLEYAPLGYDGL